ncbi:unnamed protein product [Pseudo-nitzschia multistriata]|uniref:Uncharacterized protein n=1 Tax=Pseudo-nitzschia multistriata TaxID=183589 RepID=A0A448YZD3_9STRA|nr:unnamed protein product [Pseudo-nitzschia multistriata]
MVFPRQLRSFRILSVVSARLFIDNTFPFEETRMQLPDRLLESIALDDKTDVDLGCTLRHHFHLDVLVRKHPKNSRKNLRTLMDVGDQCKDRVVVLADEIGAVLEVLDEGTDLRALLLLVQGE